ncbi:MAG: ribbon-helix-helix protein, CopG family [Chloroflexota bacterium]
MEKTTVYLPAELKAQLDRVAQETGRPAADIIREGIGLAIAQQSPPRPIIPIFISADPHFAEQVDDHLGVSATSDSGRYRWSASCA